MMHEESFTSAASSDKRLHGSHILDKTVDAAPCNRTADALHPRARVYLIGAGPGDPELLTLKGVRVLQEADVVVYDYLSNDALLAHANPQARRVYVGKEGFTHHITQDEINQILVREALANGGQTVARLKGGDPFVFGRGGEEALALVAHQIAFEVIPGITAGVGALAYAGIPVTHRGVASSMALVTGHEDPTKTASSINWKHLAHGVDTICFYMGIKNLPMITEQLIAHGKDPQTPVTLVRWGTTAKQEVLTSTLASVAADAQRTQFKAPAIICVGAVGALRNELKWFDNPIQRPLAGKTIVVTRSRSQASGLVCALAQQGAQVIELPTIAFEDIDPSDDEMLARALQRIDTYNRIVFTSANGVDFFMKLLHKQGLDSRALAGARIAVVGPSTARRLTSYGIVADVVPTTYDGHALIEALANDGVTKHDRILVVRPRAVSTDVSAALIDMGAHVDEACVYQTVLPALTDASRVLELLRNHQIDGVTFTSSSTVNNFKRLLMQALVDDQKHQQASRQEEVLPQEASADSVPADSTSTDACTPSYQGASVESGQLDEVVVSGDVRMAESTESFDHTSHNVTGSSLQPESSVVTSELQALNDLLAPVTFYSIGPMTTHTIIDSGLCSAHLEQADQATINRLVHAVLAHNEQKR